MATAIVSGRVDEAVKVRAARAIAAAGMSTGDVIKAVWERIAATGEVPQPLSCDAGAAAAADRMQSFMQLRAELPAVPELAALSDGAMRDLVSERYVGMGGAGHVG